MRKSKRRKKKSPRYSRSQTRPAFIFVSGKHLTWPAPDFSSTSEDKDIKIGQRALRHGDLLQECPLPWLWRCQRPPELLWDVLFQGGQGCGPGRWIRWGVPPAGCRCPIQGPHLSSIRTHRNVLQVCVRTFPRKVWYLSICTCAQERAYTGLSQKIRILW